MTLRFCILPTGTNFSTYFLAPSEGTVDIFLYRHWHSITFLRLIISLFERNEEKNKCNEMPLGEKET